MNNPESASCPGFTEGQIVGAFLGVIGSGAAEVEIHSPLSDCRIVKSYVAPKTGAWAIYGLGRRRTSPMLRLAGSGCLLAVGAPQPLSTSPSSGVIDVSQSALVEKSLGNLDRKFAIVAATDERLICATDLIGCGSMYYGERDGRLYFASHLGVLLSCLRAAEYDDYGVACQLAGSMSLHGRTPYRGIKRLGAAQYLSVDPSGDRPLDWRLGSYLDPVATLLEGQAPQDLSACISRFDELLRESCARQALDASTVLMLSGGRDSSALAHVLTDALEIDPICVTYGDARSLDRIGARQTTRRLGLRHHLVPYDTWDLSTHAELIVSLNGGASGLQTNHNLVGYEAARHISTRAVNGFLGDVLTGHDVLGSKHVKEGLFPFLLFNRKKTHGRLEAAFGEEMRAIESDLNSIYESLNDMDLIRRHIYMELTIRQATFISQSFDLGNWKIELAHPFYSRAFMQLCFAVPRSMLDEQFLYRQWFDRRYGQKSRDLADRLRSVSGRVLRRIKRRSPPDHRRGRHTFRNADWDQILRRSTAWLTDALARAEAPGRLYRYFKVEYEHLVHELERNTVPWPPALLYSLPLLLAPSHLALKGDFHAAEIDRDPCKLLDPAAQV